MKITYKRVIGIAWILFAAGMLCESLIRHHWFLAALFGACLVFDIHDKWSRYEP